MVKGASHCPFPREVHTTEVVDVGLSVGTSVGTSETGAFEVILTEGDKLGLGVGLVVTGGSVGARGDPTIGREGSVVDTIGLLLPGHGKNWQSLSGFRNTLAPLSQYIRS